MAQDYQAVQMSDHGVEIVRLSDRANGVEVSVVPSSGGLTTAVRAVSRSAAAAIRAAAYFGASATAVLDPRSVLIDLP